MFHIVAVVTFVGRDDLDLCEPPSVKRFPQHLDPFGIMRAFVPQAAKINVKAVSRWRRG